VLVSERIDVFLENRYFISLLVQFFLKSILQLIRFLGSRHYFEAGEIALMKIKSLGGKQRPIQVLSSDYHNTLPHATLLIAPITSKLINTAIHQFHISPHDTVNQAVIKMRFIILLDYSSFIRQSKIEPMFDYLQNDIFISFIKWWKWRINGILPSF
jgi:mRNA-degrading endonuclease toxin of MazEF toxin-antitoxin module